MLEGSQHLSPHLFAHLRRQVTAEHGEGSFDVYAPFTGHVLGTLPRCASTDVEGAVQRARAAQPAWAALSIDARGRILLKFHDLLLARSNEVLDLIQAESGKARRHAFEEVLDTALVARHYGIHASRYLKPRRHMGAFPGLTTAWEYRRPVGVVGVISPWNFPLILSITDLLAALMAGNTIVLRPDVHGSFTALWAVALLREAGLPPHVLTVVTGEGDLLGPALIDHVDYVMFTGSTRTGKIVARRAAERLIGYSLELGGKNPMIVLDDVDIDSAVAGAIRGAFVGAGQVCVSIERLYIDASIYDQFVTRFVERTQRLRMGAAFDDTMHMGSMTTAHQLATVQAHVDDAVAQGAIVLAGGRPRPDIGPLFFEPTILANVHPGMKAYSEETFGPVVALYPFTSVDDAIAQANNTCYGLNASVWSRRPRRARAVAAQIRAGSVNVNEAYASSWTATASPIGGMKESGMGRRHGAEGILKYTEAQTITVQRWIPLAPFSAIAGVSYQTVMRRLLRAARYIPGIR